MEALHLSRSIVRSVLSAALASLLVAPAVAAAQSQPSLAELARQEAERRKTVNSKKVITITAKDLPDDLCRGVPDGELSQPSLGGRHLCLGTGAARRG